MSLIAEVSVRLSALPFGDAVERGAFSVEFEPVVPTRGPPAAFVWVWGADATSFATAVAEADAPGDATLLDTVADGALYRVEWTAARTTLLSDLSALDIALLACESTPDSWALRLRAPSNVAVSDLRTRCADRGVDLRVDRITSLAAAEAPTGESLTPHQREALLLALDRGYFDDYRRTSLDELGAELGISRQAVAARLRRAYRGLAESVREESPRGGRVT